MRLAAQHIYKRYGESPTLTDCSLSVATGECAILRGPSGGGKSTLLRILALLESADQGTVIHGAESFPAKQIRKDSPYPFLTVVFQQLFLWPNLTMAQNVALALHHTPDAHTTDKELAMLERFSIEKLLKRLPHECSLGERQRLSVARALISEAQFLLLDEPSSALDKANRKVLIDELDTVTRCGRGVLLITHDEYAFDGLATKVYELENGTMSLSKNTSS